MDTSYNLQKELESLFIKRELCDVSFRVKSKETNKTFQAHKLVLATASEAFKAMFYGSMPRYMDQHIELVGIEADTFELVLNYCYTCSAKFDSVEQAVEAALAAKVYLMKPLFRNCILYLLENTTQDNCFLMYEKASFLKSQELKIASEKIISDQSHLIVEDDRFLRLSQSTIIEHFARLSLHIREEEFFLSLLRWSKHNLASSPRKTLKGLMNDFLQWFPFKNMTYFMFLKKVGNSNILSDSETLSISKCLSNITGPNVQLPQWFNHNQTKYPITIPLLQWNNDFGTKIVPFEYISYFGIPTQPSLQVYLTGFTLILAQEMNMKEITFGLFEKDVNLSFNYYYYYQPENQTYFILLSRAQELKQNESYCLIIETTREIYTTLFPTQGTPYSQKVTELPMDKNDFGINMFITRADAQPFTTDDIKEIQNFEFQFKPPYIEPCTKKQRVQ